MNLAEITAYLGGDWSGLEELMRSSLASGVKLLQSVNDSILASSGKRLRPMISLLTARALGTPNIDTLRYAAACELLHNATLMHDDVADESPERRGRPTVSALFGSSAAVLIGDFWLSRAVDLILMSEDHERVAGFFSRTLSDLAEGEMLQMEKAASADTDEDAYFSIIHNKTASLFETAGKAAAASVGASDGRFEAAKQFALCFGMAFQIRDDMLDVLSTDEELGKPVGSDEKENKNTYMVLMGKEGCEKTIEKLTGFAKDTLKEAFDDTDFLCNLADSLAYRNK